MIELNLPVTSSCVDKEPSASIHFEIKSYISSGPNKPNEILSRFLKNTLFENSLKSTERLVIIMFDEGCSDKKTSTILPKCSFRLLPEISSNASMSRRIPFFSPIVDNRLLKIDVSTSLL